MIIETYSPAGDMLTVVLCIMCWILLFSTYSQKQKTLVIFYIATFFTAIAAYENLIYHSILESGVATTGVTGMVLFMLEGSRYVFMLALLVWFIIYLENILQVPNHTKSILHWVNIPILLIYTVWKIGRPIYAYILTGCWNYILGPQWGFLACYFFYCVILSVVLHVYRRKMPSKMVLCLQQTFILSLAITIGQSTVPSTTFLTVSFMLPILASLFLFHYNSYDIYTGALGRNAFPRYLRDGKGKQYGIYGLQLKNFIFDSNPISQLFLQSADDLFKNYQVFKISDDTLFLVFDKKANVIQKVLDNIVVGRIQSLYKTYNIPYKITYMDYNEELVDCHSYISLAEEIRRKMSWNTFYSCQEDDFITMAKYSYLHNLFRELERAQTHPNILVYYQPIWDVKEETFNSIEVLSRISYGKDLIYPDEYLTFAKNHGYIAQYNKIVFNQACEQFSKLLQSGIDIKTMSINFSTQELLSSNFVRHIISTLRKYSIPKHKIAIEITENSDNECIEQVRTIIMKLKEYGIKVYLDDFGTEYSNFNRIIHWPVDVIKIDKKLTWSMRESNNLQAIIGDIVASLKRAGYQILFEGVETEVDLERCNLLEATYVQGFHYSQPVDYFNLLHFLKASLEGEVDSEYKKMDN